jgi:hypothetical protein
MKRSRKKKIKPVKRRAWHSSTKNTNLGPSSRLSSTLSNSKRGSGIFRQGLGALALASANNEPASAHLRRLLTILSGPDPESVGTTIGGGGRDNGTDGRGDRNPHPSQPETNMSSSSSSAIEDDLSDVKEYLATMNQHMNAVEDTLGLSSTAHLNDTRSRPLTSPSQIQHNHAIDSSSSSSSSNNNNNPSPNTTAVLPNITHMLRIMSSSTLQSMQQQHTQHMRRSMSNLHNPRPSTTSFLRQPHGISGKDQINKDQSRSLAKSQRKRQRQLSASRTRSTPNKTLNLTNLRLDTNTGVPIVTGEELRNDSPTFESQMNFFVDLYIKRKQRPKGILKVQTWWRSIRHTNKFKKWKLRRFKVKEENFRVWYLSQKFNSLKKKSVMRRFWVVWKSDHQDLAATKRLIGRLMKINERSNKSMMANILTSAAGKTVMGDLRASSTDPREREAYERMVMDAQRSACSKYFDAWHFRVVQVRRLTKKVQVHLQRVQRQVLASRDFKVMWPAERVGMLLKLWRRYTRFQKSVRLGRETDEPPKMEWDDLPQLDQWDEWVVEFEQMQIRAFKAASLGPMATVRRMLHRMALYVTICKDERERMNRSKNHYSDTLRRKVMYSWLEVAANRGKQLRLLRKIMNGWWSHVRIERVLRQRATMVKNRLEGKMFLLFLFKFISIDLLTLAFYFSFFLIKNVTWVMY